MKESEKKYKKIDPWKLISDAPLTILGSIALVITWPIRYFRDSKDTKLNKKNPKLRIMYSLISITDEYENLSDRELKVACSIFGTPWFQNERSKTILDLQSKIILNSFEENTKILVKYLEPLDDETIFYLRLYCSKKLYGDDAGEIIRDYDDIADFKKRSAEERKSYIEAIIKVHHNTLKGQKIKINNPELFEENEYRKLFENLSAYVSGLYSSIISTDDLSKEFDDLTKNLFEDKDSIYKSAVDANYVADKSLYGGPYHRLFDDSHSLGKMWGKIKDAKPDDSRIEEIIAWVNEAAKDLQTTMGLPIVSMEKETFDKMVEFLGPIGINKSDLYDLLTYNIQEVLSVAFLGITTMLPSIKKDKKKLNTLRGVMVASGVFGNPLALIFLLITLVHSMIKGNTKQFKNDLTSKEAILGFTISAVIKYSIDFLGTKAIITVLAILMALLIVLYFFRHVKKKKINYKKFKKEFIAELENLREMSKAQLDKENIKPLPKS